MFRNLTLRGKMIAAFSLMTLLMALLAALSMFKLAALNANTNDIATNWLPSVQVLGQLDTDVSLIRLAQLRRVTVRDPAAVAAIDRLMSERQAHFEQHRAAYIKLISSPEEQKLWNDFDETWKRYTDFCQAQVVAQQTAGHQDQAADQLNGEGLKLFDVARTLLDKDSDLNNEGAAQAAEKSRADYVAARLWLVVVSIAALIAAATLAWLISAHVLRVIGGEPVQVGAVVERIAAGDLSTPVATRSGDKASILAGIRRMQDALLHVVGEVRQGAESVATASTQIAQGNLDLSSRTEEQASSLQQTAASVEQMSSAVRTNAETASQANQLATSASQVASRGGDVVQQVVSTMADISVASNRIADIIGVIDGIAFQTNILALNAAVEAARAGEHGKGFAVVANEVRTLAQRSATAAREIKSLIMDSTGKVDDGSRLVADAGQTMAEIVAQVRRVSDLMGEITAATEEQSAGISQINTAVGQLDQATQQNAALVEESAAASESLKVHGARLLDAVSVFRLAAAN
jgi:methyl-accepting chemotaxis protein